MRKYISSLLICASVFNVSPAHADPWFTGPLIANSGETIELGHGNISLFNYYSVTNAIYDVSWTPTSVPRFVTTQISPQLSYGLTEWMDIEYDLFYMNNSTQNRSYSHIGDTSIMLGLQLLKQKNPHSLPNLRLTINQFFPTGRYDQLNPLLDGTDATGNGTYQTAIGLNFQYLIPVTGEHYLNSYLSAVYFNTPPVSLRGYSLYGGTIHTHGQINPGNAITLDLATEFNVTQNWVAVMEGFFLYQQASQFSGFVGVSPDIKEALFSRDHHRRRRAIFRRFSSLRPSRFNIGKPDIGNGNSAELTLAPAIEYNFSDKMGVIGGVWFVTTGKNTPQFVDTSLALIYAW